MNRRLGMAAVILASAIFAFGGGAVLTHAARAQGGAGPNLSCTSSSSCLLEINTSTGPGVEGTSAKNGVIGQTRAKGTLTTNSGSGVLGQDTTTVNGFGNAGVTGTSKNGAGVVGRSTNFIGVDGFGTNATGVRGTGLLVGVSGLGEEGIEGNDEGTSAHDAVFANGHGANLFRGNNSSAIDVFVVDNSGNTTIGGAATISGAATIGGDGNIGGSAFVSGGAVITGDELAGSLEGADHNSVGDNVLANSFSAGDNLFRGNNSLGNDVFVVDNSGNVNAHSYTATLAMTTVQKTALGRSVKTYAAQAAQPSLEDFGEAQLTNGGAYVRLDPSFSSSIDGSGYLVVVTAEGDTNGLYVASRSQAGFEVRENRGGRSTVGFSYRILARPFGNTLARLPLANDLPRNFMRAQPKKLLTTHAFHVPALKYDPKPKS